MNSGIGVKCLRQSNVRVTPTGRIKDFTLALYSSPTRPRCVRCRTIFVRTNDPGPWEFRLDDGRAGYWNGKPPFGVPEGRDSVPDRLHGGAESPSSDPHPRHAVSNRGTVYLFPKKRKS